MKVHLLVDRATLREMQPAGSEVDVAPEEARRMIAAGMAEAVRRRAPARAVPRARPERADR